MLRTLLLAAGAAAVLAAPARAQAVTQDHPGQYSQEDIARGALLYSAQCSQCHGRDGDQVSGIDLRRGVFRRTASDEDLARVITSGTTGGMPPFRLAPAELAGAVAYIRAGFDTSANVRVGDAGRGQIVFAGKGQCATCHRVAGKGPLAAPDLSDIGIARAPAALERSVRDPTSGMLPINRPVRIVTGDGRTIRGRRLNEDTYTVQVIDESGRLHSLEKRALQAFEVGTTSPMPAYGARLTDEEIADVVAYLLTLRQP